MSTVPGTISTGVNNISDPIVPPIDQGITFKAELPALAPRVQLFGHVTLVEGYALSNFVGCHALVSLRDTLGKTVAVITTASNMQHLLETALTTGNLVGFAGSLLTNPPTPLGGTWAVEVYSVDALIVYGMK